MKMSIANKDFYKYIVVDKETGKQIDYVLEADEETGEYEVYLKDEEGRFLLNESGEGVKTEKRKGNIEIRRIKE